MKENYKVRCVGYKKRERNFTLGKVYEVKNNSIKTDDGHTYNKPKWLEAPIIEWLSAWYKFEEVKEDMPKIVITTDGKTTTAKLYRHGEKTVKAIAKCDPRDTFDFMEGAKIVFQRLVTKEVNEKPKFKVGDFARVIRHLGEYNHIYDKSSIVKIIRVEDNLHYICSGYFEGLEKPIAQTVHPDDLEPFNFDE